jgi:hypothetical protein
MTAISCCSSCKTTWRKRTGSLSAWRASSSPTLLYPALLLERDDQALFAIIDADAPILLQQTRLEDGDEVLAPHIEEVFEAAQELLQSTCSTSSCTIRARSGRKQFPPIHETQRAARGFDVDRAASPTLRGTGGSIGRIVSAPLL